jgi:hypothetical protein
MLTMTTRSIVAMLICAATAGFFGLQTPVLAQQKTVKACQDEWRANRQANQAAGITERAFVDKCRAGQAAGQPASQATGQAANPPAPPPPVAPSRARPATTDRTTGLGTPGGGNQFASEGQARAQCPGDTVVWANLPSKVYHFAGSKDYGATKRGAYMCERQATAAGIRAAKNEKHP